MEHNMHPHANAPLHWSYSTTAMPATPQSHWAPPPQSHGMKRAMSESDCEELYSEESSKEQISPSEPGSCQLMSRKKRRGVIEKKRRDRINSSLSELKRLVPSAFEKQGSAKLEKAEILQLTVEHLKNLHSKGIDSLTYDPQRFAMDYHIIGFRECAAEVARYLVTIEGMDIQDPLRLRLMSHLQYFVQQRELSVKGCASSGSWTTASTSNTYQPNCAVTPYQSYPPSVSMHGNITSTYVTNLPAPIHPYPALSSSPNATNIHQHQQQTTSMHASRSNSSSGIVVNDTLPILSHSTTQQTQHPHPTQSPASHVQQQTGATHESHHQQHAQHAQQPQQSHYNQEHTHHDHQGATYTELTNSSHSNTTATVTTDPLSYGSASTQYPVVPDVPQDYNPNNGLNYVSASGSKPYRPWGAEMAY